MHRTGVGSKFGSQPICIELLAVTRTGPGQGRRDRRPTRRYPASGAFCLIRRECFATGLSQRFPTVVTQLVMEWLGFRLPNPRSYCKRCLLNLSALTVPATALSGRSQRQSALDILSETASQPQITPQLPMSRNDRANSRPRAASTCTR